MSLYFSINYNVNINPPPLPNTTAQLLLDPDSLVRKGLNIPVVVSTPSLLSSAPLLIERKSIAVMAHLDTGANKTSIDIKLAEYLKLLPTGFLKIQTAGGIIKMPTFVIDLHFQNTNLTPFINLSIGSCNLNFNINTNLNDSKNFALLLGRDILSRWNIVWNGPTSTVLIND